MSNQEFLVTEAAAYATANGRRIGPAGLRKMGREGKGPRRTFYPALSAWIYDKADLDEWIAEQRAQRTSTPQSQPAWLQTPEARAKHRAAITARRVALRDEPQGDL